jgi:oxygen-independent coproporphyrinogen-3 oxidase
MCHGRIDKRALEDRHGIDFDDYFAVERARLPALAGDGLLREDADAIEATSRGRLLLRIIAACFDRYLHEASAEPARFSKAI